MLSNLLYFGMMEAAVLLSPLSASGIYSATQIGDNYVDYYLSFRFFLFHLAKNKLGSEGNNHPAAFDTVLPLSLLQDLVFFH